MKRILTLFTILCGVLFGTHSARAQSIIGANYYDSCYQNFGGNNMTSLYVNVSGAASCTMETNYGDGTKKDTSGIMGGTYTYTNHVYTAMGTYTVKNVLLCGGTRKDSLTKSYTVACTFIGGRLYNDANTNCVYNTGENLINAVTQIQVDSAGVLIDTISASGYWGYSIRASAITVYKFTLLGTPAGFVKSCPASGQITYSFNPGMTAIPSQDFGFNCSTAPAYDYKLNWVRAFRAPASGGSSYIYLYASNTSCHSGTGTVTLNVSPKYSITTASITPAPASVSGNTVTWTITNMMNGITVQLYVPLTPKSTTSLGDTTCNYAAIAPLSDVNPANNIISRCDSVSNSWDPNEKTVFPSGPVNAGTQLSYTVDFENLGNDTAFNIHVQDTLSQYLDANSFALVSSTHRVIPSIYEISSGARILKFDFAGIKLESKSVPMRNKGSVTFTMKLKSGIPVTTVIPNRAGIYFDGNPVVLTNYASNRIQAATGLPGTGVAESIKVFPNPATESVNVHVGSDGWNEAVLNNTLGQAMLRQSLIRGGNVLHIATIPAGIYYLQIKGSAGAISQKIEKQ